MAPQDPATPNHPSPPHEPLWFRWLVLGGICLGIAMIIVGLLRQMFRQW